MNVFSQGVEGIRGRQGLEGPKGDEVSPIIQFRLWITVYCEKEFIANKTLL